MKKHKKVLVVGANHPPEVVKAAMAADKSRSDAPIIFPPPDLWIPFQQVDWDDPKVNYFNIDTRDFSVSRSWLNVKHHDWATISKYPHFFHTEAELKYLIERLFNESGGPVGWRMMNLVLYDGRVRNWKLKYLRIHRSELGFFVCNSEGRALSKEILGYPVDKKYLNAH